jgi:hypothetical protein
LVCKLSDAHDIALHLTHHEDLFARRVVLNARHFADQLDANLGLRKHRGVADTVADVLACVHDSAATAVQDLESARVVVENALVDLIEFLELALHLLGNGLLEISQLTWMEQNLFPFSRGYFWDGLDLLNLDFLENRVFIGTHYLFKWKINQQNQTMLTLLEQRSN